MPLILYIKTLICDIILMARVSCHLFCCVCILQQVYKSTISWNGTEASLKDTKEKIWHTTTILHKAAQTVRINIYDVIEKLTNIFSIFFLAYLAL